MTEIHGDPPVKNDRKDHVGIGDIARQVRLQQQMGMVNYAGMAELPPVVSDVREVKFKVVETEDRKHFIITAGCKTAIVHDFQEAESEVRKMFKREYKGFFEKEMKND